MHVKLVAATPGGTGEIGALPDVPARDPARKKGAGRWSGQCPAKGVRFDLRYGNVEVARHHGKIVATLMLTTNKTRAIDRADLTKAARPRYLVNAAAAPGARRCGTGRACLQQAADVAWRASADIICLDAFDHPAGAGEFYRKCRYHAVDRVTDRKARLISFEVLA